MPYAVDLALAALHLPHKRAHALLVRDVVGWVRIEFLGAASAAGVLDALREPRTVADLAARLGTAEPGLLESLLRVGESVGEVAEDGGRWRLAGPRAHAVVDPATAGLAALPEEAVAYGADVYRAVGDRLAGAPPGDYLARHGELVARASRVAEPLFGPLLTDLVRARGARRVLEVGCGSGVNLRHVAAADPTVTAVGLDVDPEVVDLARADLDTWGIADRVEVHTADVRRIPGGLADRLSGPWDLVLSMQNIYYFAGTERAELLRALRGLAPHGAVVVATAVAGTGDPAAAHLDLVLRSTAGNTPLPTVDELRAELTAAGFATVETRHLAPFQPLRAFVAT